jgi:hypothetical protein
MPLDESLIDVLDTEIDVDRYDLKTADAELWTLSTASGVCWTVYI